ncbi:MAG: hypothetical protein ABGW82_04440 [Paracoccus sp. (in: a-proteobacteria)]
MSPIETPAGFTRSLDFDLVVRSVRRESTAIELDFDLERPLVITKSEVPRGPLIDESAEAAKRGGCRLGEP